MKYTAMKVPTIDEMESDPSMVPVIESVQIDSAPELLKHLRLVRHQFCKEFGGDIRAWVCGAHEFLAIHSTIAEEQNNKDLPLSATQIDGKPVKLMNGVGAMIEIDPDSAVKVFFAIRKVQTQIREAQQRALKAQRDQFLSDLSKP